MTHHTDRADQLVNAVSEAFSASDPFLATEDILKHLMSYRDSWWFEQWSTRTKRAAAMSLSQVLGSKGISTTRQVHNRKQSMGYRRADVKKVTGESIAPEQNWWE